MKWACNCGWFGDASEAKIVERKHDSVGHKWDGKPLGSRRIACPLHGGNDWLRPMTKAERLDAEPEVSPIA